MRSKTVAELSMIIESPFALIGGGCVIIQHGQPIIWTDGMIKSAV
ncbi:hypothetical protein [Sporosarcina sp.]|nr:hypothetical protein [Sporosarcina sp.]